MTKELKYFSWRPFRPSGKPGSWTKVHIQGFKSSTMCGLQIPRKLDTFDYSSERYAGSLCQRCWASWQASHKKPRIYCDGCRNYHQGECDILGLMDDQVIETCKSSGYKDIVNARSAVRHSASTGDWAVALEER